MAEFDRVRENRVRRAAARQGLTLRKIQRRDPRALGWNRWLLRNEDGDLLISNVKAGIEIGAPLEDVEKFLGLAARDLGTATDAIIGLAEQATGRKPARKRDSK